MLPFFRIAPLLFILVLSAGAAQAQMLPHPDDDDDDEALAPKLAVALKPAPKPNLPLQDLTAAMLYEFLLGEIAAQRGSPALAAQTYVDLARKTRDPRVAQRAVQVASLARMPHLALEAARVWHQVDPVSAQAMQTLIQLLVSQKRADEAEPVLAKLMAANPAITPNLFLQLSRLLGANTDAAANLRLVQRLAAYQPQMAQARFAVAQAAAVAKDEDTAFAEVREAAKLQPAWELPAIFEAQLLQRRSAAEAARRLEGFLEKNPDAREARISYARVLAGDKRLTEARTQFEKIIASNPKDTDAIYAVGLLALQVKDYPVAEANMKRLLDLGYRDPNGVRFTLGQIAEERKDWPGAIEWYKSIQRGEHAMLARMRTANAIARQGKLAEARSFLRAVKATPEQKVQLLITESQLLREAQQHRESFDFLGEALKLTPEQPELLYDQALTAEKLERFDVMESNLQKLIQVKPDHAHAYNALGYSFAERNQRLPEAKKLIEKALELAPENFYIIDSMGWVLYRMGDLKSAAQQLQRAWNGRPDGEIGAHYGEVLWVLGERDEARRVWQEAHKVAPENETLIKTLKRFAP
ncbi:MAG: tetratricopeptide repeat protein [Proteobacteria bacterium]|nr:tetratricopeptide repeat protein [Pseudomonadota bacterium]